MCCVWNVSIIFFKKRTYVSSCPSWMMYKPRIRKPPRHLQPLEIPTHSWSTITMDFITDLPPSKGNTVIWIMVDTFSKQDHFIPSCKLPTTKELAQLFLHHIIRLHLFPDKSILDHCSKFEARFWKELLQLARTEQGLSSAYHPQTDRQTKLTNAILEQFLREDVNYQQTD